MSNPCQRRLDMAVTAIQRADDIDVIADQIQPRKGDVLGAEHLAHDDLPALLRRRRHLLGIRHGDDADGHRALGVQISRI